MKSFAFGSNVAIAIISARKTRHVRQAERWPAPWSRRRTFWELEKKVDKKKQKEVELQEIITPSFINEVTY